MSYGSEDHEEGGSDDIVFLTVEEVIEIHNKAIAQYSPGESVAILNRGLLESAVFTPQQSFGGQYMYPTIVDMAAAYMAGLASNHAFENGNKRVALAAASAFLRMNGYRLALNQEEAEQLILDLVTHVVDRQRAAELILNAIESA